jgi:hypothetical protein
MDRELLVEIAEGHLNNLLASMIDDYHYWDGLIEEGTITDDEYFWIRESITFKLKAYGPVLPQETA